MTRVRAGGGAPMSGEKAAERHIRCLSIGLFRNGDRILVQEGYDRLKDEVFHRPLGGTIEFGERAADALAREIREEIGATAIVARYVSTLENLFVWNGRQGHEIVLVFEAELAEAWVYELERIEGKEEDGTPFICRWKPVSDFLEGDPLYPYGLLELLTERTG